MPYEITKEFPFEAAHALTSVPPGHKCSDRFADSTPRIHGHSYVVIVTLAADELDKYGFIVDYSDLDNIKRWIDENLDHRNLNEVVKNAFPTTAENLAKWIFDRWASIYPEMVSVTVCETAKTSATYHFNRGLR